MNKLNPLEIKFELTKYLHEPRTMSNLEYKFGKTEKQIRNYINDNKGKIKFLNVEFPILKRKVKGKGENVYVSDSKYFEKLEDIHDPDLRSTVNPVVLPLNMTEVYALTYHLIDITKGTDDEFIYLGIAEKIYKQLSDYARKQIGSNDDYDLRKDGVVSFEEEDMDMLVYYLKKREPVCITLAGNKKIVGKIEYIKNDYYIRTKDKLVKYSDIFDKILYICLSRNMKTEI